jgi:acyl-homoserine lactone acylase PvdQ
VPLEVERHEIRVSDVTRRSCFEVRSTRHGPVRIPDDWDEVYVRRRAGVRSAWRLRPRAEMAGRCSKPTRRTRSIGSRAAGNGTRLWTPFANSRLCTELRVCGRPDGNIGYRDVRAPALRSGSDGVLPLSGAPRDADWHGWVDPSRLPAVRIRRRGRLVAANNEFNAGLSYLVTRDWAAPFRAQRIAALLGDRRGLDVTAMQGNPGGTSSARRRPRAESD